MKSIEEGFSEEERAIIACFLSAVTEAMHRHSGISRGDRGGQADEGGAK